MTYTLFIDESGDFERFNSRKGWVVSGVLCPGKRGQAEKRMRDALKPVAKMEGLHTPDRVHVTDLRTEWGDHERVGRFAEQVLRAAAVEGARFMAVVNRGEVRMQEAERTYRLMVLDLLALVDAAAPTDLDRLDLVIAQRKELGAEAVARATLTAAGWAYTERSDGGRMRGAHRPEGGKESGPAQPGLHS